MDWPPKEVKKLYEDAGLKVDWNAYRALVRELRRELERAREVRRRSADWSYIESRPEPIRTALKILVETGDVKSVAKAFSIPLDVLDEERLRARIPLILLT